MTADERQYLHRNSLQGTGEKKNGRRMACGVSIKLRETGHQRRDPLRRYHNGKRDDAAAYETGLFHPHKKLLRPSLYRVYTRFERHAESLAMAVAEKRLDKCKREACEQCGSVAAVRRSDGKAYHGVDR